MKKLLILSIAILLASCSSDSESNEQTPQETKNYNNMVFLDATYSKFNVDGNQLQVLPGDEVTVFERTEFIEISNGLFKTNTITPVAYFVNGNTYQLPSLTQFTIYENTRVIIKKVEYPTSYGKDKRQERYSY